MTNKHKFKFNEKVSLKETVYDGDSDLHLLSGLVGTVSKCLGPEHCGYTGTFLPNINFYYVLFVIKIDNKIEKRILMKLSEDKIENAR